MKKGKFGKTVQTYAACLAVLVSVAALVFAGCAQSTSGGQGGTGTLTLSIGFDEPEQGGQESILSVLRTIHPDVDPDDFSFGAKFTATSGGPPPAPMTLSYDEPVTVTLPVGTYTIDVGGFDGEPDPDLPPVAVGHKENIVVTAGQNTNEVIYLHPNEDAPGTGSFSYDITIDGSVSFQSGQLRIFSTDEDMQLSPVGSPVTLTTGQTTGTINNLAPGIYVVNLVVQTTDISYPLGYTEILHIYAGLASTLDETFGTGDLNPPEQVQVTENSLSAYITAPAQGATPVHYFVANQYTGDVQWKAAGAPYTASTFGGGTAYTAVVTLMAYPGYTFEGVTANFFTHSVATSATNAANSGEVTLVFPATSGTQTQGRRISIDFNYDPISVTGAGSTIYKNGFPDSLTLSVEGYETYAWVIDGDLANAISEDTPLTIYADDYDVGPHTASFIGSPLNSGSGIPYSESVSFFVGDAGDDDGKKP
jgi:hypothetical protein